MAIVNMTDLHSLTPVAMCDRIEEIGMLASRIEVERSPAV
jgi:hypothetical protein